MDFSRGKHIFGNIYSFRITKKQTQNYFLYGVLFHTNQIDVHDLYADRDDVTYKQYRLTFTPNFELRTDTIQIVKRKGYENDLFKEILTKYGLRSF